MQKEISFVYQALRSKAVLVLYGLPFGVGQFLEQSEFSRNMLKISTGTALATAFGVLLLPVMTRLYSPSDYGLYNVLMAVMNFFMVFASMNLTTVVVMVKRDVAARRLMTLCAILHLIVCAAVTLLMYTCGEVLFRLLNAEAAADYIPLIVLMVFLGGFCGILASYATRKKAFGYQSKAMIAGTGMTQFSRLMFGFTGGGFPFLYLSQVLGQIVLCYLYFRTYFHAVIFSVSCLWRYFCRNFTFILYQNASNLCYAVGALLPMAMIGHYCGMDVLGVYGMAVSLVDIPCGLVMNSFSTVYLQRVADTVNNEPQHLSALFFRNIKRLIVLGVLPVAAVCILAPLLPFLLGDKWSAIVWIVPILIVLKYSEFIVLPTYAIIITLRKNYFFLLSACMWVPLTFLAFFLGKENIYASLLFLLAFFAVNRFLFFAATALLVRRFVRQSELSHSSG